MSCHDAPSRLDSKSVYPILIPEGPKNDQRAPLGTQMPIIDTIAIMVFKLQAFYLLDVFVYIYK